MNDDTKTDSNIVGEGTYYFDIMNVYCYYTKYYSVEFKFIYTF